MGSKNHEILQACISLKIYEFRLLNHVKRLNIAQDIDFTKFCVTQWTLFCSTKLGIQLKLSESSFKPNQNYLKTPLDDKVMA